MKASVFFITALLSAFTLSAQNDDVYYSPKNDARAEVDAEESQPEERHEAGSYDDGDDGYGDYYEDDNYSQTETQTGESDNTYITNNYYGDYYETDYSTRLRRFYTPYYGFSYYSPCYSGYYYDPYYYNPWGGWSVSINWGWGYSSGWGYYDPWYSHNYYYPWYSGWGWGHHHHHDYWSYNHGYNHGYWDGYYDGYYGYYGHPYYNDYYGGGVGYYNDNYHYGPRYKTQGSSVRNEEKKTEELQTPGRTVNQFPAGENKDILQPVKTGSGSQPGRNTDVKNEGKPVNTGKPQNNFDTIDKNEGKPSRIDNQQNNNAIDKYDLKPVNGSIIRDDIKPNDTPKNNPVTSPGRNNEIIPKNEPVRGDEIRQAPDNDQFVPKPGYEQKPNNQREERPSYDKPQRDFNYEKKDETPKHQRDEYKQRDFQQRNENKETPRYQKPREESAPRNYSAPSRDDSPKTFDRGGSYERPQRSGDMSPSNRGNKTFDQPAQRGGKGGIQPR